MSITCDALNTWLDNSSASFGDVILIPHHPANLAPTNGDCFDPTYTPAVDVYSGWGNSLGGPLGAWESPIHLPNPDTTVTLAMYDWGLRFGFWGGSDAHTTLPGNICLNIVQNRVNSGGLTVAMVDSSLDWSRATLHDAIMERRTYATTGPLLPRVLELYSQDALIGEQGDEIQPAAGEDVEVQRRLPSDHETSHHRSAAHHPQRDWDGDGVTWDKGDCDDNDERTYPGAAEIWYTAWTRAATGAPTSTRTATAGMLAATATMVTPPPGQGRQAGP